MATYVKVNGTITAAATYSDAAATVLVETLTVTNPATGVYDLSQLTYTLYTLGTLYYLKITFIPPGDTSRSQIFPFYINPGVQPGSAAAVTGADSDGNHLQAPLLRLRLGAGAYRDADLSNAVQASARNRYEATFPNPDVARGKVLHFTIFSIRAGEPWAPVMIVADAESQGEIKVAQ